MALSLLKSCKHRFVSSLNVILSVSGVLKELIHMLDQLLWATEDLFFEELSKSITLIQCSCLRLSLTNLFWHVGHLAVQ